MGAAPSVANVPLPPILLREHAERLLLLKDSVPERITEEVAQKLCGKSFDVDLFRELKPHDKADIPRAHFLAALLNNRDKIQQQGRNETKEEPSGPVLSSPSARAVVDLIKSFELEKKQGGLYCPPIMVMVGAGISVSAGIPDFRTPGTGLYDNLQRYNLPSPESIFDIQYFKKHPGPFCTLAREMWPGNFSPTPTHGFLVLLEQKGLLLRCYSQNIDTLEREAGLSAERLVEAHGSFAESHCTGCNRYYSKEWMKQKLNAAIGAKGKPTIPRCENCSTGVVKPDITFFGEQLPERFGRLKRVDCLGARLLMVMGTSLAVSPFNELISSVPPECPRLLVNKELVAIHRDSVPENIGEEECFKSGIPGGFKFGQADNCRDAALLGDCDDKIWQICTELGWREELEGIMVSLLSAQGEEIADSSGQVAKLPPIVPLLASIDAGNESTTSSDVQEDSAPLDVDWSNPLLVNGGLSLSTVTDSDKSAAGGGSAGGMAAELVGAEPPKSTSTGPVHVSPELADASAGLKALSEASQTLEKTRKDLQAQLDGLKLAQAKKDGAMMLCRAAFT